MSLKKALVLLLIFPIFLTFMLLSSGIFINSFSLFGIKISQFYIKLDKKLILKVDNIEYKYISSKAEDSFEASKKDLTILPKIITLFKEIDIKNLSINNNNFSILFKNNNLHLENKFLSVLVKISGTKSKIFLDLENLYLKDYQVNFQGRANLDYFDKELNYNGFIYYKDMVLESNIGIKDGLMKFFINSKEFSNLHFLKKYLDLPSIANSWLYDNIDGKFKLDSFYGEYDLNNQNMILGSLEGLLTITDANIKFHKDLDAIKAKRLDAKFEDGFLKISLVDAFYNSKELKNSFVQINNIEDSKKGEVLINIETKTSLDSEILDILSAYHINLPLIQKSGKTDAKLLLTIPYSSEKQIGVNGNFELNPSTIAIGNFEFKTNNSKVILDNNKLYIKDSRFIYKDIVDAKTDLIFDLKNLKAVGEVDIRKIYLAVKDDSIIDLKSKKSDISMDFKDKIEISLKELGVDINYDEKLNIKIDDLSKFYNYSTILKSNSIKDGNILINIFDENRIHFEANISGLELPLRKDGKKVDSLEVYADIINNSVKISSIDESLKLNIDKYISIYLDSYEIVVENRSSKDKKDGIKNIKVDLKNSTLDIFSQKFYIKNGEVKIEDDESILFNALVATPKLPIILHKNKKEVNYFDIKGRYKDDIVDISTINDDLLLNIDKNNYTIFTKEYEIFYNTPNKDKSTENIEEKNDSKLGIKLFVSGEDTTFILNNKNRVIATKYELNVDDNRKFIYLENQDMKFTYSEDKEGYLDIFLYDANSSFINALSDKKILQNGSIDMFASGTMQDLKGELFVKDSLIKDLSLINNILFFVQTSPALINPLFAIPSALNINNIGNYSIQKGRVEFSYSNKTNILDLKNINVIGNGMDFEGNAKIFLDNHTIDSSLNLIFMKTYSNVVNVLPIVNYILLGDNKRVESKIHLSGDLSDPKIDSNFLKDSVNAPVNIFKRVINSPFDIFNSLMKKDEEKKEEDE